MNTTFEQPWCLTNWSSVQAYWFRSRLKPVYLVTFGPTPVSIFFDAVIDDFGNLAPVGAPVGAWK